MSASVLGTEAVLDLHGEPLRADGAAVLKALDRMLTVGSYYSREHSQYLHAAEEACRNIVRAIGARPCLALEIAANGLLVDGQTVDARHRSVRQLHDLLVPLNIARLEIRTELTPVDLRQALSALHDQRLALGQAHGFREVTIVDLPASVCVASLKVGCGDVADGSVHLGSLLDELAEEPGPGGSGTVAAERGRLAHEFRTLVGSLLKSLGGPTDPDTPPGASVPASAAERREMKDGLLHCLKADLDDVDLQRLVELARSALAMSSDPTQAVLALRLLRRALPKEGAGSDGTPAATFRHDDSGPDVEQLRQALEALRDRDEPVPQPGASARPDQLAIAFQILAREPGDALPVPALSVFEEAWDDLGDGTEELRTLAVCIVHLAGSQDQQRVDRLLGPVLAIVRRRRADLLAPLWWDTVARIRAGDAPDTRWSAVWPHLVNDLLLGLEPAPHPLTRPLLLNVGEYDIDQALTQAARLAPLAAIGPVPLAGDLLQVPVDKVRSIHAALMRTGAADRHGPNLHLALARRNPDALGRLLTTALGSYRPEDRDLYIELLRESGRSAPSRQLLKLAAGVLQRALGGTRPGSRDEAWVVPAIEWLSHHASDTAQPLLRRIVNERRLVLLRAWPAACRRAASVHAGATTPDAEA